MKHALHALHALGRGLYAYVAHYAGEPRVDVRWYSDKNADHQLKPTPRGISLRVPEWRALLLLSEVPASPRPLLAGGVARVGRATYRDAARIDVRQYRSGPGEAAASGDEDARPTRRGVSLLPREWDALRALAPRVRE